MEATATSVVKVAARKRILVWADPDVRRHALALGTFVRLCISRVERSLLHYHAWEVHVGAEPAGFVSHVVVRDDQLVLEEYGHSFDAALATWNAINRLEDRLREHHAAALARHASTEAVPG